MASPAVGGMGRAGERARQWIDRLYAVAEQASRGRLSLLHKTWQAFVRHDGPTMARSLAYYALFSIFPLLLVLISLGSSALASQESQSAILDLIVRYLPVAGDLVKANIKQVLRIRGTVGILALLSLFWSASGVFRAMFRAVNRAWDNAKPGSFWRRGFYSLVILLAIGLILLATTLYSTVLSFIRGWQVPILGWQPFSDVGQGRLWGWLSALVPGLVSVIGFCLIYRTIPRAHVTLRDVWPGGLLAGLSWEVAKQLFTWYLSNFARYSLVYGSVGAIIAFLLWSYLSALILLLGAEFTAQYSRWRREGRPVELRPPRQWPEEPC